MNIHPTAKINCRRFEAGAGTIVRAYAEIYGDTVILGRESFVDEYAVIGGGSAGDLIAGDWFHMGMFSQVNTARPVVIGDEVGLGIGTRVFTHGAYLSEWDGYPVNFDGVTIGSRVWLPNAIVMPGVTIGDGVVVAAGSVVSKSLPGDCLAGGTPAGVIRRGFPPVDRRKVLERICSEVGGRVLTDSTMCCEGALFNVADRTVCGPVSTASERLRNELRRHGIRFPVTAEGEYQPWV